MENNGVLLFLLFLRLVAARRCPNCGHAPVPYPLSTSPDCGDPLYRIRCTSGSLWFISANGSSYLITSVDPTTRKLVIRPPEIAKNTCVSSDIGSHGFWLDAGRPFNITRRNTVLLFNCSPEVMEDSWNCSPASVCHDFLRQNVGGACRASPVCCWYRAGESLTGYRIRVRKERCSAYQCFVNLESRFPVKKWPAPGVEIEWAPPREPPCRVAGDCRNLENSLCSPAPANLGQRRCFCKPGFKWDPVNGLCFINNTKTIQNVSHRLKKKKKTPLIIGAIGGVLILLIGASLFAIIVFKKRRSIQNKNELSSKRVREVILCANNSGKSARMFTTKEITKATNNFSKENLLGSGGYGEVFRGDLDDGTIVAVKRAKLGCLKGIDQILNEVRILCQVNHRSLVRLLGCCIELEQPILIYEYISNGNLFDHLYGNTNSSKRPPLPLSRRLYIAHQTAEGLVYLHTLATPRIYHRDIKSSNILLDEKLNAKVADFGLSRLAITESSHITTGAQGTLGYLDPEYYLNFQLTDKSDVYSFGVVLLELLTSKKAIDFNREEEDVNLVVYIKKIIKKEKLMEVVDPVIRKGGSRIEMEVIKALGSLAAACLDEKRQNRPSMKEVADELENIITVLKDQVPNIE